LSQYKVIEGAAVNLAVIAPGKGTLAADESCGTIKRLDAISALIRGASLGGHAPLMSGCAATVWSARRRLQARRLAVIMHRICVDGTEFRWIREAAVS